MSAAQDRPDGRQYVVRTSPDLFEAPSGQQRAAPSKPGRQDRTWKGLAGLELVEPEEDGAGATSVGEHREVRIPTAQGRHPNPHSTLCDDPQEVAQAIAGLGTGDQGVCLGVEAGGADASENEPDGPNVVQLFADIDSRQPKALEGQIESPGVPEFFPEVALESPASHLVEELCCRHGP